MWSHRIKMLANRVVIPQRYWFCWRHENMDLQQCRSLSMNYVAFWLRKQKQRDIWQFLPSHFIFLKLIHSTSYLKHMLDYAGTWQVAMQFSMVYCRDGESVVMKKRWRHVSYGVNFLKGFLVVGVIEDIVANLAGVTCVVWFVGKCNCKWKNNNGYWRAAKLLDQLESMDMPCSFVAHLPQFVGPLKNLSS